MSIVTEAIETNKNEVFKKSKSIESLSEEILYIMDFFKYSFTDIQREYINFILENSRKLKQSLENTNNYDSDYCKSYNDYGWNKVGSDTYYRSGNGKVEWITKQIGFPINYVYTQWSFNDGSVSHEPLKTIIKPKLSEVLPL